jgi:hypothetical protein
LENLLSTSRSVYFNLTSIRLEALGGVFGRNSALDSETPGGDSVLGQAELCKCCTGSNLNLGCYNINASDFLGNGVLDLDTGVNLNEVVAVLLVDQELGGTGVSVVNRLGELDSVGQDGVSGSNRQVLRGCNLNDLLVSSLDGTVTFKQVNNVAVVVTQQLNLNVLGLVQETLNKDCAVAEGTLGLGGCSLKGLLQAGLVAHHSHTTTTTTVGGLDDDWETILVSEGLDLLECLDSAFSSGDDGDVGGDRKLSSRNLVA